MYVLDFYVASDLNVEITNPIIGCHILIADQINKCIKMIYI